jgi:hypothetical protein
MIESGHSISDVAMHCISYERPNIETMAYSLSDNKYLGLHIDNGTGGNYFDRTKNPNRLSINLGKEPRTLLFVNQTINGMSELILKQDPSFHKMKSKINEADLVSIFFKYYPQYPVLKLQQNPFEVYIAPTDNIIHDGCTMGKTFPDITMVFIGYFKLHNQ